MPLDWLYYLLRRSYRAQATGGYFNKNYIRLPHVISPWDSSIRQISFNKKSRFCLDKSSRSEFTFICVLS